MVSVANPANFNILLYYIISQYISVSLPVIVDQGPTGFFWNLSTSSAIMKQNCTLCHKDFANASNFKRHMQNHTGEKIYECEDCNKVFGQKVELKKHMSSHTDEKPFQCDTCHKSFKLRH